MESLNGKDNELDLIRAKRIHGNCYVRTSRMRITPYSSRVNVIRLDRASGI